MPSDAQNFDETFEAMKEFVDEEGRHFFVIQFKDGSGRVLQKRRSEDETSVASFTTHDKSAMECMRMIASANTFEVDEGANTQQNLRNLMK